MTIIVNCPDVQLGQFAQKQTLKASSQTSDSLYFNFEILETLTPGCGIEFSTKLLTTQGATVSRSANNQFELIAEQNGPQKNYRFKITQSMIEQNFKFEIIGRGTNKYSV